MSGGVDSKTIAAAIGVTDRAVRDRALRESWPYTEEPCRGGYRPAAVCAGGESWGVVKDVGRQAGALRAVVKVLRLARMMAQAAGETLTAAHVAAARRDLEGV
ncbi:MAG: hypothetical protein Fur0039_15480 [Rhodocyclaceae bacterium]